MHIVFFEKPACIGNARQKAMLSVAGHELETKSLLCRETSDWMDCAARIWNNARGSRPAIAVRMQMPLPRQKAQLTGPSSGLVPTPTRHRLPPTASR